MQRRLSASDSAPSTLTAPSAPSPSASPELPIDDDDDNPFLHDGQQQAHAAHAPHSAHSHDGSSASEPSASAASPSAPSFSFGSPIPFRFVPRVSAGSSSTSAASSFTPRAASSAMSPAAEDRYLKVSVYFLTASMFFTFAMFTPVQNVVTTIFPSSGPISLVLLYAFFTASTIVTPSLVRWMGPANGVVIACAGYLLYTLACIANNVVFYLLASVVVGLCAGLIWTSQGAVLTMLSTTANRGTHSSYIIGGVRGAAVFCNVFLGLLLNARVGTLDSTATGSISAGGEEDPRPHRFSNQQVFFFFFCIGLMAFACFCILRIRMRTVMVILARREEQKRRQEALEFAAAQEAEAERVRLVGLAAAPDQVSSEARAASPDHTIQLASPSVPSSAPSTSAVTMTTPPSLLTRLSEIFRLLGSPHFRHFLPILLISQGMGRSYFFAEFGVVMGRGYLGYAQAVMGCVAVPAIFGLGRLMDSFPTSRTYQKKYFVMATLCFHIVAAVLCGLTDRYSDGFTSHMPEADYPRTVDTPTFSLLVFLSCIMFGAAWAGTDICMYYILGQIYAAEGRAETAFAGKAFSESLGFCLSQAILAVVPRKLFPFLAALWTIPVLLWYRHWTFPVELMHSKSKKQVAEAELASRQNDVHKATSAVTIWH